MSKRNAEEMEMSPKRTKKDDGNFLTGLTFYLHPAALSKVRRGIFEKQIPKFGGVLIADLGKAENGDVNVLIEDSAAVKAQTIIDSSKKSVKAACKITFSRMSWISQCLEDNELVARDTFDLDKRKVVTVPVAALASTTSSVKDGATAQSDQATSYIDKNRHKFVCAKSSAQSTAEDAVKANPNKVVTDELEKLAAAYKATSDTWRAFGYQKAISALKNCGKVIRTRDQAASLPGVGAKMADKGFSIITTFKDVSRSVFKRNLFLHAVMEIINEGSLRKVAEVCDNEKVRTLDLFTRIWGVGAKTAEGFWTAGKRTLDDLRANDMECLNRQQKVGLRLFDDLDERMQRAECTEIYEYVKKNALEINKGEQLISRRPLVPWITKHFLQLQISSLSRPRNNRLRILSPQQIDLRRPRPSRDPPQAGR